MLGLDLDSWNVVMLCSLGIAALAAVAVVVSTRAVITLQKAAEEETKHEFGLYKLEAGGKIAEANAVGEAAKADAAKAHADIANANKVIAEARTETARAIAEAAKANERAAELQKGLIERQNRKLTEEQKAAIIERLKPLPKGKILFNPLMTDGEATQFSDQIKSTLEAAGYEVADVPLKDQLLSLNRTGAFLWFKDVNNPPERAKNIATAFRLVGITIWGEPQPDFTDPDVLMFVVGSHP